MNLWFTWALMILSWLISLDLFVDGQVVDWLFSKGLIPMPDC